MDGGKTRKKSERIMRGERDRSSKCGDERVPALLRGGESKLRSFRGR